MKNSEVGGRFFIFLTLSLMAIFVTHAILVVIVNDFVPEPYMDEIFHVDQVQQYCEGRYEVWNPKITTPPGLYFASLIFIKPLMTHFESSEPCSVPILRLLNSFFLAVLFLFVLQISTIVNKGSRRPEIFLSAINILMFPVLFFSSILYYTDLLSLLCVVIMYFLYLKKLHVFSAVFGVLSCMMRQTNIIWLVFCCALTGYDICVEFVNIYQRKQRGGTQMASKSQIASKLSSTTPAAEDANALSLVDLMGNMCDMCRDNPFMAIQMVTTVFARISVFILALLSFGVFAIVNGGLALGDKGAHQVVFHVPQFYYWLAFTAGFGCPFVVSPFSLRTAYWTCRKHPRLLVTATILAITAVWAFTYDHPYLLADNRHYTFYIWKNFFRRHVLCKFILIPGYILALLLISQTLKNKSGVWRIGFLIAVLLVTIPNRLLEFRYFIIPTLLWRLHMVNLTRKKLMLELVIYTAVNLFTITLFLTRPFVNPGEKGLQRFMW